MSPNSRLSPAVHSNICLRECTCACLFTADLHASRITRVPSWKCVYSASIARAHKHALAPVGPFQPLLGVAALPARLISHVALVNKSPLWLPGRLTDSISPPAIGSRLSHCIIARGLSFYTPLIAFISCSRSAA